MPRTSAGGDGPVFDPSLAFQAGQNIVQVCSINAIAETAVEFSTGHPFAICLFEDANNASTEAGAPGRTHRREGGEDTDEVSTEVLDHLNGVGDRLDIDLSLEV